MPQHDVLEPASCGLTERPTLAEVIALIERDLPDMDWTLHRGIRGLYAANVLPPYGDVARLSREQRMAVVNKARIKHAKSPEEALAKAYAIRMENRS